MSKRKNLLKLDSSLGKVRRRYQGYAAAEERKRKIALYSGAAVIALLVVMLAAWGVITVITDIIAPEKEAATSVREQAAMSEKDAMVVLALKLSDEHDAVEHMVLTRFDPAGSRVYVCGLSPRVVYNGTTLGDYFVQGGTSSVAEAVAGLIDCSRVYTFSVDYTSMRKVINVFGGVTITVPYAIRYDSPNNDRNLNVAPGTREYTGWEIARLLNYPYWEGGEREQLGMYATVVKGLLNEHLDFSSVEQLKLTLNKLYEEAESDITMTDFQDKSAGLLHLCSINSQISSDSELAVVVDVWPEELSDGSLEFTGDELTLLRAAFGRRAEE